MSKLPPEYLTAKEAAKEAIKESDMNQAFDNIRPYLDYPGMIDDDSMWVDIFTLFKTIAVPVLGVSVDMAIQAVIDDPDSAENLYDLAYELYEVGLNGVAATLLRRALDLEPYNTKVITELSSNLEALMYFSEAHKMLVSSREYFGDNSLCFYLLGYNSLMTGNVDEARSILPIIENDPDETIQHMYTMLSGMVNRADALKKTRLLDDKDLRGWHLVLNGSILLHLSPFGFDEGMNGRYAFISDSYSLIKDGIMRIKKVIDTTDIAVDEIITLPDRSSRILAIATSKILDVPIVELSESENDTHGLIVVYDLDDIEDSDIVVKLHSHNQRILWAHASCWTNPFPYAADLTTYLYQSKIAPWGAQLTFNEDQVQTSSVDESSEDELAKKIVEAEIDEDYFDDTKDILSLIENMKEVEHIHRPGIFQTSGKRLRFRNSSPVGSNRFLF